MTARLEDLSPGARVQGILPDGSVEVVQAQWHGTTALTLTYRDGRGEVSEELLYRGDESRLSIETAGAAFAFDGDGELFRLVSEALRIRLAHLFDPLLALNTSNLDPLPHQIQAVYGELIPRQPLRYLLADDPGAGKTIMAGLFIKELIIRGDVKRCLVVVPGSLVEQWQDELWDKFQIELEAVTRPTIEQSRSGNPFAEKDLVIARLDHLSRNEDIQEKLRQTEWDLVIVDEAHKMSAHYLGNEVKYTKRYRLGQLLGSISRHLLLLTATPHHGKEADFQLFLALLDADRFEGKFRDGIHIVETSDLMRRLVKERLLKFDGRPLFPERRAYSIEYRLSEQEAALYEKVTEYVREEMNRAERLRAAGEGRRGAIVGFALTILQRRVASSPEAIYQSIRRRRKRLEDRLHEEEIARRGAEASIDTTRSLRDISEEDIEDIDERPEGEVEEIEEEVVDQASAAQTIAELRAEIDTLGRLEALAQELRTAATDKKWEELSNLLENQPEMRDATGARRKIIIFTEHRDTLNYLAAKIRSLVGWPEAVVTIHGGMGREDRRKAQETFVQDKDVAILVATDAAGEGINLQRAHLLVNYDLPWNPNRIEQRFGRIHRIGQTEVCHMWNLVAIETREGEVFKRLLDKLDEMREALGEQVFDVLGEVFTDRSLRDLLLDAVRYGDQPEVRAKLDEVVDATVGEQLRLAVHERALASDVLSPEDVERIREHMEQAEARKLQPHFIRAFFMEAFERLGGHVVKREPERYEITHVPADIRNRNRRTGLGAPVLRRYERITFEKALIHPPGLPAAEFITPGHPLLEATVDLTLERHRALLKRGSVLVAESDMSEDPRVLLYLEDSVQDARPGDSGGRRVVSRRLQFVEIPEAGEARVAGYAPYLDYRPLRDDEVDLLKPVLREPWLQGDVEGKGTAYAIVRAIPEHVEEVRRRIVDRVNRTMVAVKDRLTKEINYWDQRAEQLKRQELAGKQPRGGLNSGKARQRADALQSRLKRRKEELEQEKQLSPLPPVVVGGALIVPEGLLERLRGERRAAPDVHARMVERIERLAVEGVLDAERSLGREPKEMARNNPGYDIFSHDSATGQYLFIEVKGRIEGAPTVTVTKNEILTGLNKPDQFILALVEVSTVDEEDRTDIRYVRNPFKGTAEESLFRVTSVNYDFPQMFGAGELPA